MNMTSLVCRLISLADAQEWDYVVGGHECSRICAQHLVKVYHLVSPQHMVVESE